MSWWSEVLGGTAGAPWFWWAVALVVLLGLIFGLLKAMGLFPD